MKFDFCKWYERELDFVSKENEKRFHWIFPIGIHLVFLAPLYEVLKTREILKKVNPAIGGL